MIRSACDTGGMLDLLIILLDDPTPEPTEVKAGPLGFAIWMFLIISVVILGISLSRRLRNAQIAKDEGAFGDEPKEERSETAEDADPEV